MKFREKFTSLLFRLKFDYMVAKWHFFINDLFLNLDMTNMFLGIYKLNLVNK